MFQTTEKYIPQYIVFLNLFAVLTILAACTSRQGETKKVTGLVFEEHLEILKKADKCLEGENPIYTKENTEFHELGTTNDSLVLLVRTYVGCGYTGSCGDRILLIIGDDFKWSFCGLLDHVSDSFVHEGVKSFFLTNRGYQTGALKHRYDWTGIHFDSKIISRNDIPWGILEQLPLDSNCQLSYYDCFDLDKIELEEIELTEKGKKGVLVFTQYPSIFKNKKPISGKEYWLFERKEKEGFRLLNQFQNIEEIKSIKKLTNGYYNIYTEETDSISYLNHKKEYIWKDTGYVESTIYTSK